MSGKTLDYGSVEKWMSLAVWADRRYAEWQGFVEDNSDKAFTAFFHEIAVEALNRGFSLRAGYRADAVRDMLKAIAPNSDELLAAFDRIDKETWLTKPRERKQSHD